MSRKNKNWFKSFFGVLLLLTVFSLSACNVDRTSSSAKVSKDKTIINIGIQGKIGVLQYAREKKIFEKAFEKDNVEIKWNEFTSGPPEFEAIASGRLDFGTTGAPPLISGQAGGIDFRAIGVTGDGRKNYGILVQKGAKYKSLKDLKGKKIAVAPGSGAYNFLYTALDRNGLTDKDVEIVPLQPDEARPALENGSVDAWSIWESYLTTAIYQIGAVPILSSEDLNVLSPGFIVARTKFTKEHPDYTELFLKAYNEANQSYVANIDTVSKEVAASQGVDEKIIHKVIEKSTPILSPITEEFAKAHQEQADFLYKEKVIDKKVDTSKIIDNTFIDKIIK